MTKIKIIGLGNPFMGDDAVGVLVARQLHPYASARISILEDGLAGLNLLHDMVDTERLILIDAIQSHVKVGTIVRFTFPEDLEKINELAWGALASSSHDLGLAEALTLGHTLNVLPAHVILYGIELGHLQQGQGISPPVVTAITSLANQIMAEELNLSHA